MNRLDKLRSLLGWTVSPNAQFQRLKVTAGLLPRLPQDSPNASMLTSLFEKDADQVSQDEINAGQLALVAVMPVELLQARFGSLSEEYETVTGAKPFLQGPFQNPPKTDEGWRAGVINLIEDLAKYRCSKLMFERSRSALGFVFGFLMLITFVAGFLRIHEAYCDQERVKLVLWQPLLFAGFIGAGFSVLSRLYALKWTPRLTAQIEDVQALKKGLMINCILSLAEGVIAAGVVFLLFSSGLLKGELFPEFIEVRTTSETIFARFIDNEPNGVVEVAKLLLWAFVAGFSERLVPDKLNGLAGDTNDAKTTK